ncbi:hypothetical protein MNBD_BACTEROID05-917 [hydrothermal vent metagenome]|uniref:DUF2721 domain-containing protein n=1 Tax=hydrothermal vent metagenome TaxID=652676 RepID=A0A3B0T2C7_9ZZZZ
MQIGEIWLTPLLLLPGVALLIISTASRFGEIQSEFHYLRDHPNSRNEIMARHLFRRSKYYRDALVSLYLSVCIFSVGSLLGGLAGFFYEQALWVVGGIILLGIFFLVFASVQLLKESHLSLKVVEDHIDQIKEKV